MTELEKKAKLVRDARKFRPDGRWTQNQLAQKAGVSSTMIAHLEQKKRLPSPDAQRSIAMALDLPFDEQGLRLENDGEPVMIHRFKVALVGYAGTLGISLPELLQLICPRWDEDSGTSGPTREEPPNHDND